MSSIFMLFIQRTTEIKRSIIMSQHGNYDNKTFLSLITI